MVKTDERISSVNGRPDGNGVVPSPPMPTGQSGGQGSWLILGAALIAVVLVIVLVAMPGGRVEPKGTVLPDTPLARIVSDVQQALAPSSESLPVVIAKLVLAALLGGIVGYRQRPQYDEEYTVQAYIIIGFTGAMMMILIGNEMVRAVSLLGASSIIRYRTQIKDPKALAALFVTLGIGIAVGLGLYELALIASLLIVGLQALATAIAARVPPSLYSPRRSYTVKLTAQDGVATIARLEETFAARGIRSRLQEYDADDGKHDPVKLTMSVEAAKDMPAQELASLVLADGARSVRVEEKEA
jgi:uncharacterized membrane protein YhiD involved in acid resistance